MKEPIYRAFKAARVEESLAYEAADSIPDDVVSRDELLEVVARFEVKFDEFEVRFDENKAAIAENRVAIAEAAARNEAAIAKATARNEAAITEATAKNEAAIAKAIAENKVTIAAFKVDVIRWVVASNAGFAAVIIAVLKFL